MRTSPGSILRIFVFVLLGTLLAEPSFPQTPQVKIGSLDLTIGGVQATVTPAKPVIPKNIASGVQVVVTQNGQSLSAAQVAQYLGGPFQLQAEYSGPGLTQTVEVPQSAEPQNSLIIDLPAVATSGNYTLSNLRFVVNNQPVFDVTPSIITVQVIDQVLVTSVQTTPLTLQQIQQMGVVLDSSSYTGFQFNIGLQLSSQVVNLSFPVVFNNQGVAVPQALAPPAVLPSGVSVPLPTIVPVLLQTADGGPPPTINIPGGGGAVPIKIPSVIVIPGNVGYLKQFFSAQLYVSNGAPAGSNLTVDNISGTITLPTATDGNPADAPLSLPTLTSGPQSVTENVLAPDPSGTPSVPSLNPGDTGQAQWTIRGDQEGFYTINFNINATLEGLATGPFNLTGTAMGGVLVRNPYFDMTFTVPSVVRKDELFNVYATISNISQVAANNLTVSFNQNALSGVKLMSPTVPPVIPTLNAGDSTTLTFQFQSLQTGQVVATYLKFLTTDGTTGNLNFTLGVYANGTPMSPDTLVLPSSVDNLPTDVVDAAMRVLGQAWSVATAPVLPANVLPTSTNVVTQKALALAEAGLRQSLGEPLPNALRDLGTDFFGPVSSGAIDPGFDQVLRTTPAGQNFVNVLGANLAQPATQAGGPLPYELQLAQVEASGPNFLTFAVGSGANGAPVSVSLTDAAGNQMTSSTPGGSMVSGALFPLGSSAPVPYLGVVTAPTNSPYTLSLTGQASGSIDLSISIPNGDGTVMRGSITGVAVAAGEQMRLVADFSNPANLVLQVDTAGNGTFSTRMPLTTHDISPPGPTFLSATIIGPETVSQAGPFGLNAVMLFDRIVDSTTSSSPANYSLPNNSVTSASKQLSGRLVFANLSQPEGPYVPTTWSVSSVADQRGVVGPSKTVSIQSFLADPGAVVTGRVLNSDGTPDPTATVTYANSPYNPTCIVNPGGGGLVGLAAVPVQNNGTYQYRYVHQDQCGGPFEIATTDPNTGALRQVTTNVRAPGQQMVIDLTLLGLGTVTGTVKDLNANPVYNAQVVAVSGTDPQIGGETLTDANGNYSISGITVGPVAVTAVKGSSLGNSAGNIERAGTTAVVNVTLNGNAVNVSGLVQVSQGGVVSPAPAGTPVVYYFVFIPPGGGLPQALPVGGTRAAADGSYSFSGMPAGSYTITASLNGSGLSASTSGSAAAGQPLVVPTLTIPVPTTDTVNGKVFLPNNTPAAGVIVYQGQSGVLSNPDGTFSLSGVPILPSQSQTISARTADGTRSGQASVVVNSTTPVNNANITLSGLGTAQFTVLDATGKPVPNIQVTIPVAGCNGPSQTTNASGVAVFTGMPLGSIRVVALQTSGNFQDLATATANITQDGTTAFATMQFNGSGTVTGNVLDPTGKPSLGAVVQLTSNFVDQSFCGFSQLVTQSVQTDSSGNFQFTQVNVGKVGVSAAQSFFPTQVGAQGTLAKNGATINFPLKLVDTTSGVLSGTIYLPDGVTPVGAGVQVIANGALPNVAVNTDANGNYQFAAIFPQGGYSLTATDPVSGGTNQIQIYLNAGQNMTQNVRLLGTGTVNVTVVDGAGAPVSSAFVSLTETSYPNATFTGSLDASNQGVLAFPNVFEGPFSVQVQDQFNRGGRAWGAMPQGTSSVNIQVQLTTTGTVQGHVYLPGGVTPIPNANVQLTANGVPIGQFTSLSTGDVGSFSFQYVPAGPIDLKAQDPLTGRTGIAAGTLTTQNQTLTLDITTEGLDNVTGLVTNNGGPQPGANVTIKSGTFQASTQADATGTYYMSGVPEGAIVATASLGIGNDNLSGTASSVISGDGNTLTLNVALRSSGTVSGQLLQADGVTPAPLSTVTITVGGTGGGTTTTSTGANGSFAFTDIPAGPGTITAQVMGGIDQASAPISVAAGTTTNVTVKLNGVGSISGTALDSSGNPVAGTITLIGTGTFPYYLTLTAAPDGTFSLPQVLAGPFTAKLVANVGGFPLYGTTTDTLNPGQNKVITVQVQQSGTISGLVYRPDGVTFAVGAQVTIQLLQSSQGGSITLQVQNDGTFSAVGVPLGLFSLVITDSLSNGITAVEGQSLTTNNQVLNLGTIVLDGNALSVTSTSPTDGATNVPVTQALTATFSEALNNPGGIFVTNNGTNVFLSASLSSDGKTVSLQGTMPDGQPLVLNLTSQVTDVFNRQLATPQQIHFTTLDLTPPTVSTITPAYGSIQVPVTTSVVATFNKALSTSANFANVITVSAGSTVVPGTTALTASNALTFTPSAPLANNTIYTVTVNGATSFGGNVQTVAASSFFVTPETTPPVLQLISPAPGGYTNTATPTISISLLDTLTGINAATGTLAIDGQPVTPAVNSSFMTFTPTTPLANGAHTVAAAVQNRAGVLGGLSASFTVDTSVPSVATLTGITAGQTLKGQIAISASASDSFSGIAKINFLIDGGVQASLTPPSFSATLDTTRIADGPHNFSVQAFSNAGSSGPASTAIQAYVENVPLSVSITSPASGAPFKGTVTVTAVPSEPVQSISFTLGTQTVTATASPYQGTLSLAGVPDGSQTVTVTATDFVGATATSTLTITVKQTPPAAPNANLIFAEPPNGGFSLVHALPGAVGSGLLVTVTDTVSLATVTATAANDGSFATNLSAAVNDTLSLTATDVVGNVSAATLITVRSTPSLPPSAGNTSLVYQGDLVDRVGSTAGGLSPDGVPDAVFTLSLSIGNNTTRTISYITLQGGSQVRSTQPGSAPLGVAADVGAPLLNNASNAISFPITGGATLTLFADDGGFIQPGVTYTATAVFTDRSQFVGTFTVTAPADQQYVAHSATFAANPATVVVSGSTPGTSVITLTNIRDINGTVVPDGANVALSAANMASLDPVGVGIVSAGGVFTDGTPAANNANFRVYTILNGAVTATYSSQPVTPAPLSGALTVIQMQAADANGNVLGTNAVGTLDLNIRASTDQAIIAPVPSELYADGSPRVSQFTVQVRDVNGNPVADGTPVLVTAQSCGAVIRGTCVSSVQGTISGGSHAAVGSSFQLFLTHGGTVQGQYSTAGINQPATVGTVEFAILQVLPSDSAGDRPSTTPLGTASITLAGGGSSELSVNPASVAYVFPVIPVEILVHHLHDERAQLVPDGANVLLTAQSCGSVIAGSCVSSIGGTITDGNPSPTGSTFKSYSLSSGLASGTYTVVGASQNPATGQALISNIQLLMADPLSNRLGTFPLAVAPLEILGPGNAVGSSQPASVLGDGGAHTTTVTFTPILDAYGNIIPDGSEVLASAASCAAVLNGTCVSSVSNAQVLNGGTSPTGPSFAVYTVQGGKVAVTFADQGTASAPGQVQIANVVLLPSDGSGNRISTGPIGIVPVNIVGLTSASASASPVSLFADGADHRTTVTLTNFKDAAGQPVPDGTVIAVSAQSCFTVKNGTCVVSVNGGEIVGTNPAPFNSNAQLFTVTNGQVVLQYSDQGISVPTGEQTATVQVQTVTPQGNSISSTPVVTLSVPLLAPGSAVVAVNPSDVFADSADHRSQVTISSLLESDGVTPIPDGSKVAITVAPGCPAVSNGSCVSSAGGALLSAGTSPGDGTTATNSTQFEIFTVAGGQVQAIYSDLGISTGVNQTLTTHVSVVPASNTGSTLTTNVIALGTILLHGTTSTSASGANSVSISSGGTATVTFSGIKDSAGNTVPDGTNVAITAAGGCTTINNGSCVGSVGGTIIGGTTATNNSRFSVFPVRGGSVTITYSPNGASPGTATLQVVPADVSGNTIGNTDLFGGTWAITVTN